MRGQFSPGASQVRYAKTAAADANRLKRAAGVCDLLLEMTRNDKLRENWVSAAGLEEYYDNFAETFSLSQGEAARLDYAMLYFFWLHWGQFASSKDEQDYLELENVIKNQYGMAPMQYSWKNNPVIDQLDPNFRRFVDGILSNTANKSMKHNDWSTTA